MLKWLTALTLALLGVVIVAIALNESVFREYSRTFGSLSQAQFQTMNARMDALGKLARAAYLALSLTDLALIVVAIRARARLICGLSILLALALALFFLVSLASVGPAMIG